MEAKIFMRYPGSILSVNHYKFKYYTKPETKAWMEEFGWELKRYHIEDWKLPLIVKVEGVFRDKRSTPDLHNLLKVICDEIEEVTGINDKTYITETREPLIRKDQEPTLIITISELRIINGIVLPRNITTTMDTV